MGSGVISQMSPRLAAASIAGRVGSFMIGNASGIEAVHLPGCFPVSTISALPLLLGDGKASGQVVALEGPAGFDRYLSVTDIAQAYDAQPQTRVYESSDLGTGGWQEVLSLSLASLLRYRVICTLFESVPADLNLGAHFDQWQVFAIQLEGRKHWRLRPTGTEEWGELETGVGDGLFLPQNIEHAVSTHSKRSVHLQLTFVRNEPIQVAV